MGQNKHLQQLQFEMLLDEAKANFHNHIKLCGMAAEHMIEYHRALQEKGFTQAEALQIVIAHGLKPGGNCGN